MTAIGLLLYVEETIDHLPHCRLDSKIICFCTFLKELFSLREGTGPFHAKFNENKIYISHNLYLTRFHCCKSLLIF